MKVSEAQLSSFRELLAGRLGLAFDDDKRRSLQAALHKGVLKGSYANTDALLRNLAQPHNRSWDRVVESLTVGETSFFRQWDQLRALTETVLPLRIKARGAERRLNGLSAGCASGEEPYSIAMLCASQFPELDSWQLSLKGVDINRQSLAKAAKGLYSEWSLRDTPTGLRQRFFQGGSSDGLELDARPAVQEWRSNGATWPRRTRTFGWTGRYDFIFCRNMLMYHTPASATGLLGRICRALVPGGFLFLGLRRDPARLIQGLSALRTPRTASTTRAPEQAAELPPARYLGSAGSNPFKRLRPASPACPERGPGPGPPGGGPDLGRGSLR